MIIPDTNLLLYAYNTVDRKHTIARTWLESVMNGSEPIGFCWPVLLGFLRLSTSKVFLQPFDTAEAIAIVNRWLAVPHAMVLQPTDRHWILLSDVLSAGQVRGPLVTDAEIATCAIEHGGVLHSADRDFLRFPKLKVLNPLGS